MTVCRECGKPILGTVRKEFCHDYCRGAYHRRKYRQQKVEEAEDRLNGNGHSAAEKQQASEAMAAIVKAMTPRFVRRV